MLLCHCRHHSLLAVSGHVFVSRDTSLCDSHGVTRIFACALYCGVTATGLRARGTLLDGSEAVVHGLLVTTRVVGCLSHFTSCCLLKQQVSSSIQRTVDSSALFVKHTSPLTPDLRKHRRATTSVVLPG